MAGLDAKASGSGAFDPHLIAALRWAFFLNLAYFAIEFTVAATIHSVALFADSVDFLEDMALNGLVLAALRFPPPVRARLGMVLAGVLLLPAGAMLVTLVQKLMASTPVVPAPIPLSVTGLGSLAVNATCAFILARVRTRAGSLTRVAFLSARNDVIASLAIMAAGGVTALWPTIWPDVVVGLGIGALNADSAHEVWTAARRESRAASELGA